MKQIVKIKRCIYLLYCTHRRLFHTGGIFTIHTTIGLQNVTNTCDCTSCHVLVHVCTDGQRNIHQIHLEISSNKLSSSKELQVKIVLESVLWPALSNKCPSVFHFQCTSFFRPQILAMSAISGVDCRFLSCVSTTFISCKCNQRL